MPAWEGHAVRSISLYFVAWTAEKILTAGTMRTCEAYLMSES